jgi:DNA-binding GntR family transcriptional regulator
MLSSIKNLPGGAMVTKFNRPPTLTSAVVSKIREAILKSEISPGQPLRENELHMTLGVARGTIREALYQLQEEGLIEIEPHRGAFVIKLSPQKAWEIFSLREMLETKAARLALEQHNFSEMDFKILEHFIEQMSRLKSAGSDLYEFLQADLNFHMYICERSNHQLLMGIMRNLQSLTLFVILHTKLLHSDLVSDDTSHQNIVDVLKKGDPDEGEDIIRRHLQTALDSLLTRMKELEQISA